MKNIGLLSDLHLDGSNMSQLNNPGWDYLVIAGDLATDLNLTQQFFSYKTPDDIPILYVLGNHEFEGRRFDQTFEKMEKILRPFENVKLLYNESVIIDDIKFIGSTLWTNFESGGVDKKEENMKWAKQNVSDFTYIFTEKEDGQYRSITPQEMEKLSEECIKFLDYELRHNLLMVKKL
jgi:predicted MPP superfamily phosphohydrolase